MKFELTVITHNTPSPEKAKETIENIVNLIEKL